MNRPLAFALVLAAVSASPALAQAPSCPEYQVNTYTTGHQSPTDVASDAAGNFFVVWSDFEGQSFGRRFIAPGVPVEIEVPIAGERIAAAASGYFVAVDVGDDGNFGGIFASRYSADGFPIGATFLVNNVTSDHQTNPAIASDPGGNFVVAWQVDQPSGIAARLFDSEGIPRGPQFQVTISPYIPERPAVAMDAAGNFVVAWETLAAAGDDFGAVVARRFDAAGVAQGAEFRVNTYTTAIQAAPDVAYDASGNFIIAWNSEIQDGNWEGVFAQRFAATGTPLGSEFPVNTHTPGYQVLPSVAVDPGGEILITWTNRPVDPPGMGSDVYARRFSADGVPAGPDFLVNTYTTGYQNFPQAAAIGGGRFVVAWSGRPQDVSDSDAFLAGVGCGLKFHPVTPCRLADTRVPPGPPLEANSSRSFAVTGACGVPADARAVALNLTVAGSTHPGHLRLYPSGQPAPPSSVLNFTAGRSRANNALATVGANGLVAVRCDMPTTSSGFAHLILDVSGYFK